MRIAEPRILFIFFLAVASRLAFYLFTQFIADDAFITFRYAENIANGVGFVYNEGERLLGTTTPLFTLILAFFSLLKIPVIFAALVLSFLSSGITAVLVYRIADSFGFTIFKWLPVLSYIFWPRSFAAETGGMETAFFAMLITLCFYLQRRKLVFYAIGAATLATLTRPEGAILLLLILVYNIWEEPKMWTVLIAIPLFIITPWLAFSMVYFGSVIPHSVIGKLALYSLWGKQSLSEAIVYLMAWHTPFGWAASVAAIAGGYWLIAKKKRGVIEAVWLIGMITFFAFSSTRLFFWYIVPIYPIYVLFVIAPLPMLYEKISFLHSHARAVQITSAVLLCAVLLFGTIKPLKFYGQLQQSFDKMHKAIGLYLAEHAGENDLVAAEDIGYMGFYSGRKILDRDGLVSPESVPYNRSGQYLQLLLDHSPEFVVAARPSEISTFHNDSIFLSVYHLEKIFRSGATEYLLYALKDSTSETISGQAND